MRLNRVTQRTLRIDRVVRTATLALPLDVLGVFQLAENAMHGAFRDSNLSGDIPHAHLGIRRDTQKHVRVIGQERPLGSCLGLERHSFPLVRDKRSTIAVAIHDNEYMYHKT